MKGKTVDLKEKRQDKYVKEQLEKLGLDKEMIEDYDPDSFKEKSSEILSFFFKERDRIYDLITDYLSQFDDSIDTLIFWSVMCEHFQHLIMPDISEIQELVMNDLENHESILDYWLNIANEFEKFQMSTMSTYYKRKIKE